MYMESARRMYQNSPYLCLCGECWYCRQGRQGPGFGLIDTYYLLILPHIGCSLLVACTQTTPHPSKAANICKDPPF